MRGRAVTYLEELEHSFGNPHTPLDRRLRKIHQCFWRRILRGLHHTSLALLAHFWGSLGVRGVNLVPLLHPVMHGLRSFDSGLSRNVFFVVGCQEFKELNLLLCIKVGSDGARSDKLRAILEAVSILGNRSF